MVKMNQYVMSTRHSKCFFSNIIFGQLFMNIDCENIIEHMYNRDDDYRGYIQKVMILQVIPQIFCEMLIGGRNIVYTERFFGSPISGQMFKMILRGLKGYFM